MNPQQIANNIKPLSKKHKVIRFLAKMWRNRTDPTWQANDRVTAVITNGDLDISKIRDVFIDRGICTANQFDTSLQEGVSAGLFSADLKTIDQTLLDVNDLLEGEIQSRLDEVNLRYQIVSPWRFYTQNEKDYLDFKTDILI